MTAMSLHHVLHRHDRAVAVFRAAIVATPHSGAIVEERVIGRVLAPSLARGRGLVPHRHPGLGHTLVLACRGGRNVAHARARARGLVRGRGLVRAPLTPVAAIPRAASAPNARVLRGTDDSQHTGRDHRHARRQGHPHRVARGTTERHAVRTHVRMARGVRGKNTGAGGHGGLGPMRCGVEIEPQSETYLRCASCPRCL